MYKKSFFESKYLLLAFVFVLALLATPTINNTITYNVSAGETISLICIDIYGYYNNLMGEKILKLNPQIKNINSIRSGQKLKLPNPTQKTVTSTKTNSIFKKQINATQGVVTYVEGDVKIRVKNSDSPRKLIANTIVYPGDVIKTSDDGRVELIINRESVVRMKHNTMLVIKNYRDRKQQKGKTKISFSAGGVWAKIKKFSDKISRFQLELPTAVAGVYGTVYQSSIYDDGSSEVKVYNGEVNVKNNPNATKKSSSGALTEISGPDEIPGPHEVSADEWVQIVRSMQSIKIDKNGRPATLNSFSRNPNDSWEKWNEERDKQIAKIFSEEL